jgi:hypothetical protein
MRSVAVYFRKEERRSSFAFHQNKVKHLKEITLRMEVVLPFPTEMIVIKNIVRKIRAREGDAVTCGFIFLHLNATSHDLHRKMKKSKKLREV